ncbi:reverse transcriptase domain-containing protein [Tanacetum coccineum]
MHNIGFDTFIDKVFTYHNVSVKIDSVNIKVTNHNTIARVSRYAMSHSVTKLSIDTCQNLSRYFPITCDNSSDALTSLTLKWMLNFGRFPKFDNLVSLQLERVKIVESELFSCFPNLEELALVDFKLPGDLYGLEVINFTMLRLTISSCYCNFSVHQKLMLLTPKLVFLNLKGIIQVNLEAYEVPLLETIRIDHCYPVATIPRRGAKFDKNQQKDNAMNIFKCFGNAKCVQLSLSTIGIASSLVLILFSLFKYDDEGTRKDHRRTFPKGSPSIYRSTRMIGGLLMGTPEETIGATPGGIAGRTGRSTLGGEPIENVETPLIGTTPSAKEQIEGYLSALKSIRSDGGNGKRNRGCRPKDTFQRGSKNPTNPEDNRVCWEFKMPANIKLYDGTTDPEDHLSRFSSVANLGEWSMPVWCRMFQQTLDVSARGWFENLSGGSIDGWVEPRQHFTTRFSTRRACFKDPTKITKIVRKTNETLVAFKERWIIETCFITGVPEVIKISSFMDAHKCPELAKRAELPKGEASKALKKSYGPVSRREDRFHQGGYGVDRRRNEGRIAFNSREGLVPYRAQAPYQAPRDQGYHHPRVNVNSLTKLPKEILASKLQLNLQPPRPMQLPTKKENQDRYCDYHGEKGHYTNDCFQLKRQLEISLESGSIARCDVRALLRELKSRHEVTTEEHSDGFSGFRRRVGETIGEDLIGGGLRRRAGLRGLRAVSSTIHSMIKFLTPRGIATLVTRKMVIAECQRLEKKQMVEKETGQNTLREEESPERVGLTKQALVNSAYPNQLVTIGGNLSEGCKDQLKTLLKKSTDVFAWELADMTEIPRRIIEHSLNANPLIEPVAQKRRVMASDRTQAVIKEVENR